jgi:hypothetical protein
VAYVLTNADIVWNRALSDDPGTNVGDQHLRLLAKPYGRIMNGGVASVMDICTANEVQLAADTFAYLGLADLAGLTRRLVEADWTEDRLEERLNRAFYGLDCALEGAFERKYAESPDDFDPVVPDGTERLQESWVPDGGKGRRVCTGELIVHEHAVLCTRGDACPDPGRSTLHSSSHLHANAPCELCPSGPAWAGQAASP